MTQRRGIFTYENGLLILLGMSFGVAFFDRTAGGILVPYITKDIPLNNTQTAFINSSLAITWAIGAYVIARWSDAKGARKPFLLSFLVIFSLCSIVAGLANSYPVLLISRMIMGAVEGPFLPVCLAIMAVESSEHRRGVNSGIMQNFFAALMGQSLAPLLLVFIAEHYGWRQAFFVAGIPGLLCAVAVYFWVREPAKTAPVPLAPKIEGMVSSGPTMGVFEMLRVRNIFFCCLISIFMVAWMMLGWTFFAKYFVEVRGFTGPVIGTLLSVLGYASAVSGFGAPALSDRIGRKPVMIGFCLLGVLTPLAVLYFQGSVIALGAFMFLGWFATGTFPLFMGVIPGESIPRKYAATAMGLVVCVGEVVGGFGILSLAGRIADMTALSSTLVMQVVCSAIGCGLCLFLVETAPAKVQAGLARTVAA